MKFFNDFEFESYSNFILRLILKLMNNNQIWSDTIEEFQQSAELESEHLQDILLQIQGLTKLDPETRKKKLAQLSEMIQKTASKEDLQELLDTLDLSLGDYMGDPRRFVTCISQLLSYYEANPEKTMIVIQRFLQDKQGEQVSSPAPFDWTMVDILFSQLNHLSGGNAVFTKEMRDSIVFSLFPSNGEDHFLQDLVYQFLSLSIGEQITVVRQRMQALSQAPLSKVTLLSNMLVEIHDRYEKEAEKLSSGITEINIVEKHEE